MSFYLPPECQIIKSFLFFMPYTGGRFIITNGHKDLCIRVIRPEDAAKKFACLTTNRLTGETKISESVGLTIKGKF
jgi:hypothetical protein